jgi:hypothetical protein
MKVRNPAIRKGFFKLFRDEYPVAKVPGFTATSF